MKVSQLVDFFVRRMLPARQVKRKEVTVSHQLKFRSEPLRINNIIGDDGAFRFLNHSRKMGSSWKNIKWDSPAPQRLWEYHLHYFDYLRAQELSKKSKLQLMLSWDDDNPQGQGAGWEPFPTSLRIVNWVFFLSALDVEDAEVKEWNKLHSSLSEQTRWLSLNTETHILANHYFENIKAMLFAGSYLAQNSWGDEKERWEAILLEQLDEQFLDDGGHFERSPMYHALMLENLIDLLNLWISKAPQTESVFTLKLRKAIELGLDWLGKMSMSDGRFPLFNDSTYGVAPQKNELIAYASRLGLSVKQASPNSMIRLNSSGYYGYRASNSSVIVKCGNIGPKYQPGHTHSDQLSYELDFGGHRVVVDSGVSGYCPGAARQFERSTAAHNTIMLDGASQSEMWGEFRVARRSEIVSASSVMLSNDEFSGRDLENTEQIAGQEWQFIGAFRGFWQYRARGLVHKRKFTLGLNKTNNQALYLKVVDNISNVGAGELVSNSILLGPEILLRERSDTSAYAIAVHDILTNRERLLGFLDIDPRWSVSLHKAHYSEGMNIRTPSTRMSLTCPAGDSQELWYRFRFKNA